MKSSEICFDTSHCTGCGACYNICRRDAISMREDRFGFVYPQIDNAKCIDCGLCRNICPINAPRRPPFMVEDVAVFVDSNHERLMDATSGGAFGVVARYVLNQKGVVFGCYMDRQYNVNHIAIDKHDDLILLQGSKYVQSDTLVTYRECRDALIEGRYVLYSGCPCQVDGLKSFLKRDYDNLITMDLICHGVPNQRYFKSYVDRFLKENCDLSQFKFRSKKPSRHYKGSFKCSDYFMTFYLWGLGYRKSCYRCRYAGEVRVGDFTIGDMFNPEVIKRLDLDAKYGASTIIFNSEKSIALKGKFQSCGILESMTEQEVLSEGGGQLMYPSKSDIRTYLIHWLFRLFGSRGVQILFSINKIILKFKR